ncbi:MAG TPA: (2Fe-2S) ferredoxin domain-containing protein [Acholeplasmataceae bacterium]|nr:(2Fe-2S) ferredoxin domain-containing protein [Acholeplasmataceae bacterium]
MITLADLEKIRSESNFKDNLRKKKNHFRIIVGMATCGITAGAKEVYDALVHEVNLTSLKNVEIVEVGCIGECALEPIVEIYNSKGTRTTYCKVKPEDAERIINRHILKGFVVEDLLLVKHKKAGNFE